MAIVFAVILLIIVSVVLNRIAIGTLTVTVSDAFLGNTVRIREAFQDVKNKLGKLLGSAFFSSLIISLGILACIFSEIYFLLSYYMLTNEVAT